MPRHRRALRMLPGLSILLAGTIPVRSETDAWTRRADRETRIILRALIAEKAKDGQPCDLDDQWVYDRVFGYKSARKYLGSTLRADVTAPEDGRRVSEVIDPKGEMSQRFCGKDEFQTRRKRLFEDFSEGKIDGDPHPHGGSGRDLASRRIELGRPVFDNAFRTAAFFVTYETITRRRSLAGAKEAPHVYSPNGIRKRDDLYAVGIRYIYRKRGSNWVRISDDVEFRAE